MFELLKLGSILSRQVVVKKKKTHEFALLKFIIHFEKELRLPLARSNIYAGNDENNNNNNKCPG